MPFWLSVIRRVLAVARIERYIVRPDHALTAKRWSKHGCISRHWESRESLFGHAGERVQHIRFALFIDDVVKERPELRAYRSGGHLGYFLNQFLQIQLSRKARSDIVQQLGRTPSFLLAIEEQDAFRFRSFALRDIPSDF